MPAPALITPAPNASLPDLLARAAPGGVCGYISGDPNQPVSCPGTSTCVYSAAYHWGCCDQLTCWNPGTCENEGVAYCGGVNSANCVYSQILQCSGASPSCVTYIRSSSYGGTKLTSWTCGTTEATIGVLAVTTTGGGGASSAASETTSAESGGALSSGSGSTDGGSSSTQVISTGSSSTSFVSSSPLTSFRVSSVPTYTNASTATSAAGSSSSASSSSGQSTDDQIKLAFTIAGPIIGLLSLAVAIWLGLRQKDKKKKKKEQSRTNGGDGSRVQLGDMNGNHSSYANGNQHWAGNSWTFNFGDNNGGRR